MKGRARRRFAATVVAGAALVVALAAGPGFTASLGLAGSGAGDGAGAVSGFTVSDVDYVLGDDPSALDAVAFTLDPAAAGAEIQVRLLSDAGAWYPCSTDGAAVRCDTSSPPVALAEIDELRVVAAD